MHKKYTDGAVGNGKEIVIFYGFNSQKQRKTGKNTKKQEKNNAESKKKTENFAKSPFFYDLKNFVTFSIFIVTLSIHKSVFLCYNKFAKQKICGFFAPHAHARKFFRAGGGDDNAKRRFADIRRKSFGSQSEKTVQISGGERVCCVDFRVFFGLYVNGLGENQVQRQRHSRFFRDYRSIELSVLAIVSIVAEVLFIIIKTIRNMAGDEDKTQMWKQMGHSVFNNLMYLWIVVKVFWM